MEESEAVKLAGQCGLGMFIFCDPKLTDMGDGIL